MVKVYVDERERSSGVPEYLKAMGLTVIYKLLDVGDYLVNGSVVIERKRVDDLVRSVFDGRFFSQVSRLAEECDYPLLLIEGDLSDVKELTSKWRAIEGALITVVLMHNIPLFYTRDPKHSAEVIKHIAEKISEGVSPRVSRLRRRVKPKDDDIREWQLHVLQSLPGIGPKTAHRLLEKFHTVKAVFNASLGELVRVEGINEEKAARIIKILTTPYTRSGSRAEDLSKFIDKYPSQDS